MKRVIKFRKSTIYHCARCGETHKKLRFKQAVNPIISEDGTTWEWWALCPNTGDPVLMRIVEPKAKEEVKPFWTVNTVRMPMQRFVTEEDVKRLIRTYSPFSFGGGSKRG
jgi:hypothetical protein